MLHKIKHYLVSSDFINVLIIILAVSLLFGVSIFQSTMTWRTDTYFHMSRIYDISQYLHSGQFPLMVDVHAFANTGQAINGMYPNFSLLPFIFVTMGLKPIAQYQTITYLFILSGSLLNYFVFQKFYASKLQALAAVFATFTFINIFYQSSLNLHGVWSIYFLLPLAILSIKKLSEPNSWPYVLGLAIAVSFVLNTHLLSVVFMVGFLAIYFVYQFVKSQNKLALFFKTVIAAVISVLLSLPTLISIISLSKNHLSTVQSFDLASGTLSLESMIHSLTNPTIFGIATPPIYGVMLLADILLILNVKKFSMAAKVVTGLIFATEFIISPYFPWKLLNNTPVAMIQFPGRLVPFLLIIATMVLFTSKHLNNLSFLVAVILGSFMLTSSYQTSNLVAKRDFPNFRDAKMSHDMTNFDSILKYNQNTKIDNEALSNPEFYRLYSYHEYIPQTAKKNDPDVDKNMASVNNHELLVNNQKLASNSFKVTHKNN
ncbi:hypothetical protein EFL35_04475 [Weissella paramesenteroides]|uniref:hypothetical protein n=1 Tax=Weissella paramesenteroides TaxID=1249 RepID=UPI00223B4ABC|nr:hypothetical protein [Weissella paramesenteroides]MCS9984238.1 hypothetical protein [Weissella paramesenteroides]MCS9998360.1 hypothetical protein [Weissella paramesenteroides]MCT0259101.1 hypothetical protein [Weissella paramesenteroides]